MTDPWDEEPDYEAAKVEFECKKVSMKQDKNGFLLVLSLHPQDTPEELFRHWVGVRYKASVVPLDDEEKPIVSKHKSMEHKTLAAISLLCRNEKFWVYLSRLFDTEIKNEEEALLQVKEYLGIESRKELLTNKAAADAFMGMVSEFKNQERIM